MRHYADFVELIASLGDANPERGIRLISARFEESFHPYRELFRIVRSLAGRFREEGVRKGDKVLVALDANLESICSFLALVYVGAVPFSVPSPLIGQDREIHRKRLELLVDAHGIGHVLASKDLAGVTGASPLSMRLPDGESHQSIEPVSVSPDDDVFVQFSSGSTASPKGVRITHRNLIYNAALITENDRRTEDSVWVSWIPLYHDMGLVGGLFTNFLLKNDLVLMPPRCFIARPISWLAAASKWKGTITAVPNFALDICVDRVTEEQLQEHGVDLGSFRVIYNGSEPVRVDSVRRFEEKFGRHGLPPGTIYPVYGMSETTLAISSPRIGDPIVTRRIEGIEVPSVGFPLGDFEARIRGEDGTGLPVGAVGEIWVRGTSVTPGYLPIPGQEQDVIRDGWLATGDLGVLDEEGRLYVSGRKKDLIIYQGRNFYGHDIASRVEELPFVRSGKSFVFGLDVDGREEIVVVVARPKLPVAEVEKAVRQLVLREFGVAVYDVGVIPQIPKTTSGKVSRHRCRDLYLAAREGRS